MNDLTLRWTLVNEAGISPGVSCSWMMERYPFVLAEWYTRCRLVPGSGRLSCTACDSTRIAGRSDI